MKFSASPAAHTPLHLPSVTLSHNSNQRLREIASALNFTDQQLHFVVTAKQDTVALSEAFRELHIDTTASASRATRRIDCDEAVIKYDTHGQPEHPSIVLAHSPEKKSLALFNIRFDSGAMATPGARMHMLMQFCKRVLQSIDGAKVHLEIAPPMRGANIFTVRKQRDAIAVTPTSAFLRRDSPSQKPARDETAEQAPKESPVAQLPLSERQRSASEHSFESFEMVDPHASDEEGVLVGKNPTPPRTPSVQSLDSASSLEA